MNLLERSMSARRDVRSYLLLFVGLIFAWAGATVDPSKNCDESGRECAPWLVPVAFVIGVLSSLSGAAMLAANRRWGSRLRRDERRLDWWDTRVSPGVRSLSLDDVARIRVRIVSDGSDRIFFYNRAGALLPFPAEEVAPPAYEEWARYIHREFPHIAVEVEAG